jgi:thiol-disulfide isomerase/thioredoxin
MSDSRRAYLQSGTRFALVLAAGLLAGCGPAVTGDSDSGRIDTDPAASIPAEVELVAVDRAGFDAAVAGHLGRVVLVDFWATWCGPCVEQLPHTLELARQLGKSGLAVVTVSLDDSTEAERVGKFLRDQGAGVATNLISQFGANPQSMDAFEIAGGAVPYYQLYDRTGTLRQTFGIDPRATRQFSQQDIDAAIDQLLSE